MSEKPDVVYGRLLESAHLSGYSFERLCDELMWLLDGERWQGVGSGHKDVNAFLRSIDLSPFNLGENRPKLHKRIKELQPKASNRAIAAATGASHPTVGRDIGGSGEPSEPEHQAQTNGATGSDEPPRSLAQSASEVAERSRQAERRKAKDAEREKKRQENAELVTAKPIQDEMQSDSQRYATIVIDPPWDWGDEGDHEQLGRGQHTYSALSFEDLLELPVGDKAAEDAQLYLWITNRSLPKGFALLEAWGFRYVTALTWVKPSIGMGNYFRGSTEHVLFGVRGSAPLLRRDVGTHFAADRPGGHSAKPPEFFELVESCSPGPWLELFGRDERPGWATFGAEVGA